MDKKQSREYLKEVRSKILQKATKDEQIKKRLLDFLALQYSDKKGLFIYESFGSEVATKNLIQEVATRYSVYVPEMTEGWKMHAKLLVDIIGNLDVAQTNSQPDIAIVPLLGFTKDKHRIGYGKACYDRFFIHNPKMIKIGIAYDEQRHDFLPEIHDVPLDYIVTPTRIV